jgi:hypothetical protein
MKISKIISLIFIGIFLISLVSSTCNVLFDKESYSPTETVTAELWCSEPAEKSQTYTLNWTNSTGDQIELDTGTTPATKNQRFYENYILPSEYTGAINATFVEAILDTATDGANVTGATGSSLLITNASFGGGFLGEVGSIKATVKDELGKKITGGFCKISGWSNDETKMLMYQDTRIVDGEVKVAEIMPPTRFEEGTDYAYKILCYCGSDTSGTECIDEDGSSITDSIGSAKNFFTTSTWLEVNTLTDKTSYELKSEVFVCANVTNVNYSRRIPLHIFYQIRCSKETDNNQDTDRILVSYNMKQNPDMRGISTNTTQMQCIKLKIPEEKYLMGRESECYASSTAWVLDNSHREILGYSTTSPVFNITSSEINLEADWQWTSDTTINSIVNLSNFNKVNASGTGDIDIRLDFHRFVEIEQIFNLANILSNITIKNLTDTLTHHTDYELEFLEDGFIELEIRDVNLSHNWFNISLDFYDLGLREIEALEGIENKTGTFHLDVNCPSTGTIGGTITCPITAYVEDSQTMQKEVDFTCHISDGVSTYSSTNFNQMITRNAVTISRDFAIPSSFSDGTQYVLQCYADYYNLGSRRDSFYDTFTASTTSGGGGGGSGGTSSSRGPGITGGAVDEKGKGKDKDIGDIIDEFNPFSPNRNWAFIFLEAIALAGIISLVCFFVKKRKRQHHSNQASGFKNFLKKTLAGIFILLIIFSLGAGIWYGYKIIKNSSSEKSLIESNTLPEINETSQIILQGNLIKSIFIIFLAILMASLILILFSTILVLIISKLLNVRGEIRFGKNYFARKFSENKKLIRLQKKLDITAIKNQIKHEKNKTHYKIRKTKK